MLSDKPKTIAERYSLVFGTSHERSKVLLSQTAKQSLRLNALKNPVFDIKLLPKSIALESIKGIRGGYYVLKGQNILSKLTYFDKGSFVLQNASSFLPVLVLDPKSNEVILDLCAAPGMKTSHIAALSNNKASLTANDSSKSRFFKMKRLFGSLGVNAQTTLFDGRNYPKEQLFDKILLDAPCSGESEINLNYPKTYTSWNIKTIKRLGALQRQLLKSAYSLLKPGGILVYSTCTIAPEENEKVVNYLLKRQTAEVIAPTIDIPNALSGLTEWNGKKFDQRLANCARVIPDEFYKAFFIAKIQKPRDSVAKIDTYK